MADAEPPSTGDGALQTTTSTDTTAESLDNLGLQLQGANASDPGIEDQVRSYTSQYIEQNGGPSVLGTSSQDEEAVVQQIVENLGDTGKSFEQNIRDQVDGIIRGRTGDLPDPTQHNLDTRADPVMMFNGQYTHQSEDLRINGAGIDFVFRRTYKNQVAYYGPLGVNWTHNYNMYLQEGDTELVLTTGDLKEETYTRHPRFGEANFTYFVPPDGQDAVFLPSGDSFVRRGPDGLRHIFQRDPDSTDGHRLSRIEDRYGNYLQFGYNTDGQLDTMLVNHPNRVIRFQYDSLGHMIAVSDYTGRIWCYEYDGSDDLIAVTSPPTDCYPAGLTTQYEYSTPFSSRLLQHNLIRILDPAGQEYLENEYGDIIGDTGFNRVVRQRQGGGEALFEYQIVDQAFEHDYIDAQRPAFQTNFVDRNGHPIHFVYNKFGNLILKEEQVLDGDNLRLLAWRYRYNRDGNLIASLSPERVLTQYYFGRDDYLHKYGITDDEVATHDQLTIQERLAFGRLLAVVRRGKRYLLSSLNLAVGVWGDIFPDVLGGVDPEDIVTKFTYEPDYNQLLTVSDPRFTERADPNFAEVPAYFTSLTQYEYVGPKNNPPSDPHRFLARVKRPDPTWPDGTKPGPIVQQFTDYDDHGRLLQQIDPAGTVTELSYFGTAVGIREGYLQRRVVDVGGLAITTEYEVDNLGRVTAIHQPRAVGAPAGHFVTSYEFNTLDQSVNTTISPPFSYVTRCFYDCNGKLEREERDAKDETGADIQGAPQVRTFCYDEQLNLKRETIGGQDLSAHLITQHFYNGSDKRVLTILPGGNRIRRDYDERLQEIALTVGADTADAATIRSTFDGDGRRLLTTSPRGFFTAFTPDVFGQCIEQRDPVGNILRRTYDKAGNLIVERIFERQSDGSFTLTARSEFDFDTLNRQIRQGRNLFPVPLPVSNLDTDYLASPGPGHLLITSIYQDSKGRPVRFVDPLGRESQYEYDALDRITTSIDPDGNRTESQYDANGNLVRRDVRELVRDPLTGIIQGERVFSSAQSYDELDRLTIHIDSLGNITRYSYDSQDNQSRRVDPLGNIRRNEYDIYGRRITQIQEMTSTGLGGGVPLPPIITRFEYDPNGNQIGLIDPLGRRTAQLFDALNRLHAIEYPDRNRTTFDYDPDSNVVAQRDNNGLVRRYTVDPLGRTTRIDVDRSGLIAGIIVEGTNFETYTYDALGRRLHVENDFAQSDVLVNSLGWPFQETLKFTTPTAPFAQALTLIREFNDAGMLMRLTYPDGRVLQYDRNKLNQVTQIQNLALGQAYPGSPGTANIQVLARFDYMGSQRSKSRFGNGAAIAWSYDGARRLVEIQHQAAGFQPMLTIQHLFDAAGNMRFRNNLTPVGNSGDAFIYDSYYWLTRSDTRANLPVFNPLNFAPSSAPPPDPIPNRQVAINALIGPLAQITGNFTWSYDLMGNRVQEHPPSQPAIAYTTNNLDQYTTINGKALIYDMNGNLISDGAHIYRYDFMNRLVRAIDSVTGLDLARFFHDAQGRRILEISGGVSTHLVHNQLNIIAEYRTGVPFAQFVHNDMVDSPVQIATGGNEYWYHGDLVSSVRALTDKNGVPVASYLYTPFGITMNAFGPYNPLRFASRRIDGVLESYDVRTRQYNPIIGRFTQRDTAAKLDGSNLYLYASNNPLTFVDPLGTEPRQTSSMLSHLTLGDFSSQLNLNALGNTELYPTIVDDPSKAPPQQRFTDANITALRIEQNNWRIGGGFDRPGPYAYLQYQVNDTNVSGNASARIGMLNVAGSQKQSIELISVGLSGAHTASSLNIEGHATMFNATTGNLSQNIRASGEVFGASAVGFVGDQRLKLGGFATIIGGEVEATALPGVRVEFGGSIGLSLGVDIRYGVDTNNNGYGEWGLRLDLSWWSLGFFVEPDAMPTSRLDHMFDRYPVYWSTPGMFSR